MKLLLRNGRLLDPTQGLDAVGDALIVDGTLEHVGPRLEVTGARVIELDHAWVCPGLIDLRSVLKDARDLAAALEGGFTTVVAAPESMLKAGPPVRVLPAAPLTRGLEGHELGEVPDGAVCLSQGSKPVSRAGVLRRALQYAATRGKLVMVHAEDPSLTGGGVVGEGLTPTRLGLPTVPASAETSVVARDLSLLRETGGRLHFSHLTVARSLDLVRAAKREGLQVSCDVTPHHLTRTTDACEDYALEARVWPPLRSAEDVAALREGVRDGTVDAVACDHTQVDVLDREHPFEACVPGGESFSRAVPTLLELGLAATRLVELLSLGPARLLGLHCGLKTGVQASLTVIDPRQRSVSGVVIGTHSTVL